MQVFFLIGMVAVLVACAFVEQRMEQRVIFPHFENQILSGHKDTLKSLVDSEIQALAPRLASAKTRAEQTAIIEAETDPIRVYADKSGYFFAYDTHGVRVNVPINKAQNGQNQIDSKDAVGFPYVKALVDAALAGGGFVEYHFEKPGQGIQPKLSYAAMIPGTDLFIGTGVYTDDVQTERAALGAKLDQETRRYYAYIGGLCLAVLALMLIAGSYFSRSITRVLREVAEGLGASAGQVASASGQLSLTSQSLASGSSEQAASIEETSATLEVASSTTNRNVQSVKSAEELARDTRRAADQAVKDMAAMSQAMDAIKNSSNDIAKIIKAIDEIAFQTNILALNAAVEAARAGEAGMGFAVVADEVRNLAQRSAEAARETANKIEGAIAKSQQGVTITSAVAKALDEILAKVRKTDELSRQIATASQEQAQGLQHINQAIGEVDKVTQANAASAEETAASAEELNAQAEIMKGLVADLVQLVGINSENPPRQAAAKPSLKEETWTAAGFSDRTPALNPAEAHELFAGEPSKRF